MFLLNNTKNKIIFLVTSIIVVSSIIIIFLPFIFGAFNKRLFTINSNIKINNNVISVQNLTLKPGIEELIYLDLKCNKTGMYKVNLNFIETVQGTLKEYLYIKIIANEKIIYEDYLVNVIKNNDICIINNFKKGQRFNIDITYCMPKSVGNEAQGSSTEFDIEVVINEE